MRRCLIAAELLLCAGLGWGQSQPPTPPPQQQQPPANQPAPRTDQQQTPPDLQNPPANPGDQTDTDKDANKKEQAGFKNLKKHFSSWCVGAPVNHCYEKKEDADAASAKTPQKPQPVPQNEPAPRISDGDLPAGDSSSRENPVDLSPPGSEPANSAANTPSNVAEFRPYDPHKAMKDVEVGDFYFDKKNFNAAYSRYQEALEYKPNDAEATFKLAEAAEKLGKPDEARAAYQSYLKILPHGPRAEQATQALEHLKPVAAK